jgi:hypothetical protein
MNAENADPLLFNLLPGNGFAVIVKGLTYA